MKKRLHLAIAAAAFMAVGAIATSTPSIAKDTTLIEPAAHGVLAFKTERIATHPVGIVVTKTDLVGLNIAAATQMEPRIGINPVDPKKLVAAMQTDDHGLLRHHVSDLRTSASYLAMKASGTAILGTTYELKTASTIGDQDLFNTAAAIGSDYIQDPRAASIDLSGTTLTHTATLDIAKKLVTGAQGMFHHGLAGPIAS